MRETINLEHELLFNNNIAEISSISLECVYDTEDTHINGNFIVEGTYRSHEVSLNQESFNFKIPFTYEFASPIEEGSATVNVKDFTYNVSADTLTIFIEYEVAAEKAEVKLFEDKAEFERFINDHEVDIEDIPLAEEVIKEDISEEVEEEVVPEKEEVEKIPEETETEEEIIMEEQTEDRVSLDNAILEDLNNREDTYITYHIHICTEDETLESIANRYKISVEIIKDYNNIENITNGTKLIIPCGDE